MKLQYFLLLLFYLSALELHSQNDDITFRKVSPPGGFSFQAVHSFNQDKFGYIWMGSFDGIIRYNSKEIVRFTHNHEETNGLPSNNITSLVIDNQNNIWVSTNKGLCLFNHKLQQFEQFHYNYEDGKPASNKLFSSELDGNGTLWISDETFFGYLDIEKKQLIRLTEELNSSPRLLYNDETNNLWLGTIDGTVYSIDSNKKKIRKKIDGPGSLVRTICTTNDDIWVGYEAHGARLYDLNGNLKKHITYRKDPEFDIESASVRKILRDTKGQIWIGTYHGLFVHTGKELIHYNHEDYEGLPHNSIYGIFEDIQGGLWIGTWAGGVSYLHHADNKFNNFRHSQAPASISDNMVSSFAQTANGEVFVGTEQDGLNKFDLKNSSFKKVAELENEGVLNIKALCVDQNDGLWAACAFKGIFYRPKNYTNFIHFEKGEEDGKHLSALGVYALCESDSGIWMGTNFGGLNFYNFHTKQISFKSTKYPFSELLDLNIRSLTIDSRDNLWISTEQGMFKIHLPSGKLTLFNTNSDGNHKTKSQSFYHVSELSDGNIWIGTGGDAINIYNPETNAIRFFDANGLIKGKDAYGVIESQNNNIWITTNDGLILYNTKDNSSRRFVITDGIQGNLFNPNAIFTDKDGNLYFGGTNGFTQLEPKEIRINKRAPNILINNIKVNQRNIIPVQTDINEFSRILLNPRETTLNFNFSADNYLLPEKNKFNYRLTNYVDQWVQDGNNGTATFINIPAGEYVFEVKSCNNDGVWNETPARLSVVIKQFWYKSNIAKALYLVIILTIILLVVRFYVERLKLKKALLIEKIKHENEEHLNEMKLRFFTNISHEFRTPLTLINWPVKNLMKSNNLNSEERDQLETVKRNTNRLLQLINQIMDLRKVEKGVGKLNISRIELVDFVKERILNFTTEAKAKNIKLSYLPEKDEILIEADEEKLDKIIYNLLSNAFKFTSLNGEITVVIKRNEILNNHYFSNQLSFGKPDNEDFIEISITDNGQGIDSEDLPNIFERFEQGKQVNAKEKGTGIGLSLCKDYTLMHRGVIIVQSTPDEGSRFSVRFPTKQKAQKILYENQENVKTIHQTESLDKLNFQHEKTKKDINILVVEDNADLRKYIIKFLQSYYNVIYAENGIRGLEILKTQNVQLIISDVMMPSMDGFEFCQKIKSQIETSHIPVILLTALSSSANTSTGLEKGADAYISKPFDERVLLSQIENLLQQRKRLQENYTQRFITKQSIDIGSLDNYFLNKLNSIIEKNMQNEDFSVDMLSSEMGFSRSQLHRKLKHISSHSTSEYITIVKIRKATALLVSGNFNIDEVAFKTGFNSTSYFNRCFKKIHTQSPKEYLKGLQE